MKHPALLAAVLGVVLCIAGMCLRGIAGDVMAMVLVGGGAVTCVAGLVWLLSGRRRTRCPNCGAAVNTGPYVRNLAELSQTGTLHCPRCGAMIQVK